MIEILTKFYGVDWLCFLFIFTGVYLLGNQTRAGFIFGMLGCLCGVCIGCMVGSVALILMDACLAGMYLRGFIKNDTT